MLAWVVWGCETGFAWVVCLLIYIARVGVKVRVALEKPFQEIFSRLLKFSVSVNEQTEQRSMKLGITQQHNKDQLLHKITSLCYNNYIKVHTYLSLWPIFNNIYCYLDYLNGESVMKNRIDLLA